MRKKQTPTADDVMQKYEALESRGHFDDAVNEAIVMSKFKSRLARVPSLFDRPLTVGDAIALIELVLEWYESKRRGNKRTRPQR